MRAIAGVQGAAGVAVAAAGAHRGGGDLAVTASTFLLVHAAAGLALVAGTRTDGAARTGNLIAATMLIVGVTLFSGDLALAGLANWRPLPVAAPIGGTVLLLGWIAVPIAVLLEAMAGRR